MIARRQALGLLAAVLMACSLAGLQAVKLPVAGGSHGAAGLKTPWQRWFREKPVELELITGQRIPRRYFVTKGFGETDEGAGANPFETGAHDLAMEAAGIHNHNLMSYTSILPPEAEEISFEEAQKYFHHGAVLECIIAEINGGRGDRVTAGVGRMMVRDRHSQTKKPMGGFAVEYVGHAAEETAKRQLEAALGQLFDRRFTANSHEHMEKLFTIESQEVTRAFGTALAAICFVDYVQPVFAIEKKQGSGGAKAEL